MKLIRDLVFCPASFNPQSPYAMAKLAPGIQFTGPIGGFSAYKMKGVEGTVIRAKGGPSGETIASSPNCAPVRRNISEFPGPSKAASAAYKVVLPLKIIFDYMVYQAMVSQLKALQKKDNDAAWGQRNIRLSMTPGLFDGFQLSQRNPLESIVITPLPFSIYKETLTASIEVPALRPGMNFFPIGNFPVYKWMFSFGIIPDLVFDEVKGYIPTGDQGQNFPCVVESRWFHISENPSAFITELSIPFTPGEPSFSLMLAAGIGFGVVKSGGDFQLVESWGGGKVIAML